MRKVLSMCMLFCFLLNAGCTIHDGATDFDDDSLLHWKGWDISPEQVIPCAVYVNDKKLDVVIYYLVFPDNAFHVIPILAVMEGLGAEVTQKDDAVVEIKYEDDIYVLDMSKDDLLKEGSNENLLVAAPGSRGCIFEQRGNDYFADEYTLILFFREIGVKKDFSRLPLRIYREQDAGSPDPSEKE